MTLTTNKKKFEYQFTFTYSTNSMEFRHSLVMGGFL